MLRFSNVVLVSSKTYTIIKLKVLAFRTYTVHHSKAKGYGTKSLLSVKLC